MFASKYLPDDRSNFKAGCKPALHFRQCNILVAAFVALFLISSGVAAENKPAESDEVATQAAERAWAKVPEILARIVAPKFPDREFVITTFGAVADGETDSTDAFRKAIDACNKAGGGKVVVPKGTFLTGAIHLKSNVNLHIVKDATIRFSTNTANFLPVVFARYESTEVMNYSPFIYAFEQENIAITGEGTLDGQGSKSVWHQWKQSGKPDEKRLVEMGDKNVPVKERVFGEGHMLRPNFVQPIRCRNVLIEGIRLIDAPMWALNPVYCTNVTVRGVTIDTKGKNGKAPNTDGCNPESSTDVLIEDCVFNTDDDCIAIKAGRDTDGRRVNIPSQNIIIRNCKFSAGHGGVTAGSETAGGVRNVFAENCHFDSPDLKMAIRLKTNPKRGGFIEDFYVRNCTVKKAITGIHMTMRYDKIVEGAAIPFVRNIDIRNVTFDDLKQAIVIEGISDDAKITDVTIANCEFKNTQQKSVVTFADRVNFINTSGTGLE
ncbi:MAG: glycoside hydrolase family 28 protein [Verrucomicrobia bacterium]|nr:glycoside hydrolase family 28 protein [Verrucomicrobiota bacterium]